VQISAIITIGGWQYKIKKTIVKLGRSILEAYPERMVSFEMEF
jgi:hypothetical protein